MSSNFSTFETPSRAECAATGAICFEPGIIAAISALFETLGSNRFFSRLQSFRLEISALDGPTRQEAERLSLTALERHHEVSRAAEEIPAAGPASRLEDNIHHLTGDLLTERERQIVGYLLRGYSSKACARELDISPATERVHRKNIYQKLGVNSQSGLLARLCDRLFAA